jgi:hypothetical protein
MNKTYDPITQPVRAGRTPGDQDPAWDSGRDADNSDPDIMPDAIDGDDGMTDDESEILPLDEGLEDDGLTDETIDQPDEPLIPPLYPR